jgi:tripartite-type tricarboxylate transporter receptor subunit TctC
MRTTRRALLQVSAAPLLLSATAFAQERYPTRPIETIVPWGPGGGADQTARKISRLLETSLKVSLPVVNVPGGTGVTGLTKLLAAPADGYSLLLMTADTTGLQAIVKQRWSLDDLSPLATLTVQRSGLFVREGGKYSNWSQVAAGARAGEIKVAINGLASPEEISVNAFKKLGFKFTAVPYQRPGERYAALLGDHVDLLYEQAGDIKSFIDSRQITPIVFLATERLGEFKDIPTTRESGIEIVSDQYRTLMIKAGTDPTITRVLVDQLRDAATSVEYTKYLEEQMADPKSYLGPEETKELISRDIAALKRLAA